MAEDIKALIDKIQSEGVQAAEEKSAAILAQAQAAAQEMVSKAKKEAAMHMRQASENIAKMEAKQKALLAQASRDMLLELRKEINAMLGRIIAQETRQALSAQAVSGIITELVMRQAPVGLKGVEVKIAKEELAALENSMASKIKDEVRKHITLKPSEEIRGGFTISFDAGKSQFDFSDQALAEYIGTFLKPRLNELLKSAIG